MSECFKHCSQCNLNKDINCFGKLTKNNSIYYRKICSECRSFNRRQNYQKDKGKILLQNKQWSINNIDKKKQVNKLYYLKNKDKILLQNKNPANLLRNRLNRRKWAALNKEQIKQTPSYKKRKLYTLKYIALKLKNNISFRLRTNVSKTIGKLLKKQCSSKHNSSILKYLPYSIQELKQHLESKFEPWMNWNNWGIYRAVTWNDNDPNTWTWQIDHIIPQSALVYHSMEDDNFKKCWSLNNIRPLSAKENILKSNKY